MKFRFNVNTTEQDYIDYNVFVSIKSPYGRRQMRGFRVAFAVLFVVYALVILYESGFSREFLLNILAGAILQALIQIFLNPLFSLTLKSAVKGMKKSGKMAFSPESVLEFYINIFAPIVFNQIRDGCN